ncbi:MAG: hypothetical protein DME98_12615 [Verrucomicrobia bacterium]|nr:MAG: hypothetical protein DME98_12615 [Verrucomicrobiota bacterium]PYJ34033.1 MAG: hypothetical protein DME88_06370 [Verrucomicrobiota bacterium]
MKPLFRIFELTKNEQRVVLIVMLVLTTIAFVRYERRVHRSPVQPTSATEVKPSPTVGQIEEDRQSQPKNREDEEE